MDHPNNVMIILMIFHVSYKIKKIYNNILYELIKINSLIYTYR